MRGWSSPKTLARSSLCSRATTSGTTGARPARKNRLGTAPPSRRAARRSAISCRRGRRPVASMNTSTCERSRSLPAERRGDPVMADGHHRVAGRVLPLLQPGQTGLERGRVVHAEQAPEPRVDLVDGAGVADQVVAAHPLGARSLGAGDDVDRAGLGGQEPPLGADQPRAGVRRQVVPGVPRDHDRVGASRSELSSSRIRVRSPA